MEVTEDDYKESTVGWANFDDVEFNCEGQQTAPAKVVKAMRPGVDLPLSASDATDGTYDTRVLDGSLITMDDHDDEEEQSKTNRKRRRFLMWVIVVVVVLGLVGVIVGLVVHFVDTGGSGETDDGSSSSSNGSPSNPNERRCNGLASNCALRANEIVYATVNEAMSSKDEGFEPFHNLAPLEEALGAGFRGLFLSSCECGSQGVQLCSEFCATGYRRAIPVFEALFGFLEANRNEVVILNIEVFDDSLLELFTEAFDAVSGLESIVYSHPSVRTEWPTLGDMIDDNQRLIVFQDGGPNCAIPGECPPGVHNTYAYMFETPSKSAGLQGLNDYEASCAVERGSPRKAPFFISNHFAQGNQGLPNPNLAVTVNDEQTLKDRLGACQDRAERDVNMLAVDYWSIGDALQVVQEENERRGG